VVAGALVVAAVAKFRDLAAVREQMRVLTVPAALAPVLPVSELGVAALVLLTNWGAWLAVALLLVFTLYIVKALATGQRDPCPCFGVGSAPMSAWALLRNGWLLALAVLATGSDRDPSIGWVLAFVLVLGAATAVLVRAADHVRER
jgi:hypothetical protein